MRRSGAGFTLVETIIAVTVLGIFMGAAVLALMTTLNVNAKTDASLANSSTTELMVSYFNDDVMDADAGKSLAVSPTAPNCKTSSPQTDTLVLDIVGSSFDDATPPLPRGFVVSYVTRPVVAKGATTIVLHRLLCEWTGASTTEARPAYPWTTTEDVELGTLDSSLDSTPYVAPVVTCVNSVGATVACTDSTWVKVNLLITPVGGGADAYTVSGSRRTT
ncbi:MAG: type II secretion system protein [Actinomycetes bacterium]